MLKLRLSAAAAAASLALAGLVLSAPLASAASVYNPNGNVRVQGGVYGYGAGSAYSRYGNESVFPNTEDHSAECINGYRWQRHNHDWDKTTAEDTVPLRC